MANFEKLPEMCHSVNGVTGKVIIIKRGEHGFWDTIHTTISPDDSQAIADARNKQMGITKIQEKAMYVGSLFGWDVPGADPDNYNEDGTLKELPTPSKEELVARYRARVKRLHDVDDPDALYQSADFQCDQTEGFPTMLICNWAQCEAWLEIREDMASSQDEIESVTAMAADWGFHLCNDAEDFNHLLADLGEDAVDNASIPEEDW